MLHCFDNPIHLAFFSTPGPQEMIIVGIVALLLFGKRLPEVARNLGKGFSEFKKGLHDVQNDVRSSSDTSDRHVSYQAPSSDTAASRPDPEPAATSAGDDDFTAPRFDLED